MQLEICGFATKVRFVHCLQRVTLKGSQYILKFYSMLFQQSNKQNLSNKLLIHLLTDKNAIKYHSGTSFC